MIFMTAGVLNRWCHKNDIVAKGTRKVPVEKSDEDVKGVSPVGEEPFFQGSGLRFVGRSCSHRM